MSQSATLKRFSFSTAIVILLATQFLAATDGQHVSWLTSDEQVWLDAHPVIRVAPDPYFPPIEWIDSSGAFKGIAADYLRLVERSLGVRFEVIRCATWDEVLAKARNREVDLLSAAAQTPDRSEYLLFTEPHLVFPGVIIARTNVSATPRLNNLERMKVAVVSGYIWHEMIAREHPGIIIDAVPDIRAGLSKVSFGIDDAMIENVATATWCIEREGITNLMICGETPYASKLSFAVRNDWPELQAIMDKALANLDPAKKDAIYRSWISLDAFPVIRQPVFWISLGSVVGGALLIVLLVVGWNRSLRRLVAQRTRELEAALQAIPDGLYVVDRRLNLVMCNAALERMLVTNRMAKPKIGRHVMETLPTAETPYLEQELHEVFTSGTAQVREHSIRLNDSLVASIMRRVPILDPDGKVRYVLTVVQDVTVERTMQDKLRESEHKFSEMVENANCIILCMDRSGLVTFFNSFAESFFGFSTSEIVGRSIIGTIVPATDSSGIDLADMMRRLVEDPSPFTSNENENIRKDGSRVWISWTNKPIYDLAGNFNELLCVGIDITRLKQSIAETKAAERRADTALTEAQMRYRFLFEESPAGALIMSGEGIITDISRSMADALGYSRSTVIGRPAASFVVEDERDKQRGRLAQRFRNEQTEQVEVRVRAGDGSIRTILFSAGQAILHEEGKPEAVLVTGIDITARKAAEELARQRELALVQADKLASLGTLVSGVAHEINNPNNFIILNADNLSDIWKEVEPIIDARAAEEPDLKIVGLPFTILREEMAHLINGLRSGAHRIRTIVTHLKDFARQAPVDMDQEVDLVKVVDAAHVIVASAIKKCTGHFELVAPPDIPKVKGDFQKLEQVVINLLSNACQALTSREQAVRVTIRTLADGSAVQLSVEDEGSGIAADNLPHIFDPFFTTKRDSGGTGLGLSISYGIIKDHAGAMDVISEAGKGTTFTVTLPVYKR
jgi:PAS domain S-box-containing protein